MAERTFLSDKDVQDLKTFGKRMRSLREHQGLSQSDLEALTGVPKARLSRYENGHVIPTLPVLARIAAALNTPVQPLVEGLWSTAA